MRLPWPFSKTPNQANATWEGCSIEWVVYPPTWTAIVHWRGIPLGRAHLTIKNGLAELEDIHIGEDVVVKAPPWGLGRGASCNFQGLGIGSGLLDALVALAAKNGATLVWGQITDLDKVGWYERRGFTFDPERSRVSREL